MSDVNQPKSTEEDILDTIMSQDSTSLNNDLEEIGGEDEQPSTPAQPQTGSGDSEASGDEGQGDDASDVEAAKRSGEEQPKPQTDDGTDRKAVKSNKDGDLVDAQGNVVARRGKERRFYQTMERQAAVIQDMRGQMERVAEYVGRLEHAMEAPKRLGLAPEDLENTFKYAAIMKQNPVNGAKAILAMVLSQGYTLDQIIGADSGAALNTRAISEMIDNRLAPISSRFQQQQSQEESMQQAQAGVNAFYTEHPDAEIHEQDIVMLMGRMGSDNEDPQLTARRAWAEISRFINDQGLDATKPIKPQVLQKAREQLARRQQQPQNPQRTPLPNGRGSSAPSSAATPVAKATDSWDDIIRRNL